MAFFVTINIYSTKGDNNTMKFDFKYIANPLKPDEAKTFHFLRNLNTEKMFRDDKDAELQAQLTTLFEIMANFEQDPTDKDNAAARLDLQFSDTRHEVLQYMYAELKDGKLVQNETTRKKFDELEIDEQQALTAFFRSI